jgi:DNA-binding response OmpR family regulator
VRRPRVLLYDNDPFLQYLLVDVFLDEDIDVSRCGSLADIHAGLDEYPDAIVVSDSWSNPACRTLPPDEHQALVGLAARARLIVATTRHWALHPENLDLGENVTVLAKPFDLEDLVGAVRSRGRRADAQEHLAR